MTARCAPARDLTIYFVLCRYRDGLYWAERDAARCDKRTTIEDIRTGQFSEVVQIIELNVPEFSSRDVTEDMIAEAKNEAAIRWCQEADVAAERRDWQRDHRRDHLKNFVEA